MMSRRFRRASVLLLLFLVCSQGFASELSGPTPRRQKRGIMKMMMHIMWDPVRLIRYWYAYDVTKEIAKSWRKILPTMLLLPFNPNLADAPGIAKYVHPSHGLRATKFHKNTKQFAYPAMSSGETYSASQFPKDYLISDSALKNAFTHFTPGSGIVFEGSQKPSESSNLDPVPLMFQQYLNSGQQFGGSRNVHASSFPVTAKEVDGSGEQQQHRIVLKPVPESFLQSPSSDSQEVAFPGETFPYRLNLPGGRGEHVIFKGMPLGEIHDISKEKSEGDVVPSSSNSDSKRTKNKYFKYPEAAEPSYVRFQHPEPHSQGAYEDEEKDPPPTQHVIHTGHQELHIVLHPIPIGQVGPSDGGQALHFVPVSFNASESGNGGFPFVFPGAVTKAPENASPPNQDEEFYPSNNASGKNDQSPDETDASSSERSDGSKSSRITWVLKHDSSSKTDRRKDTKTVDNDSDGSVPKVSSLTFQDAKHQGLRLNGETIDLLQLKEDLRHGTPVLIPFHKKATFSSPQSDKSTESGERVFVESNSAEQYDARNSTQRLIFFFKRP